MNNSKTEMKTDSIEQARWTLEKRHPQNYRAIGEEEVIRNLKLLRRYLSEKLTKAEQESINFHDYLTERTGLIMQIVLWEEKEFQTHNLKVDEAEFRLLFKREQKNLIAAIRNPGKELPEDLQEEFEETLDFYLKARIKDPEREFKLSLRNLADRKAWDKIYTSNHKLVIRTLIQRGASEEDAETAWGESIFRLCEYYKKEGFYPDGKLKTLLILIAKNYWIAQQKSKNTTVSFDIEQENEFVLETNEFVFDISANIDNKERKIQIMSQCLEELKEHSTKNKRGKLENAVKAINKSGLTQTVSGIFEKFKEQLNSKTEVSSDILSILKQKIKKAQESKPELQAKKFTSILNYLSYVSAYDVVNTFIKEELTHKEIHEKFDISISNSKVRLNRGRKTLIDCMDRKLKQQI